MQESGVFAEFKQLVVQLSDRRSVSLNLLFDSADSWGGMTTSWVKDRYYGRTKVSRSDCDRLHGILAPSGVLPRVVSELSLHKDAIAKMCGDCAGISAVCWDSTCPLRPVSPMPLRAR